MICVAGMPRSGTSLITQLLHRCNVDLGPAEQLMPASSNNSDGFWENLRFVRLNEQLLAASGGSWFAPPAMLRATPEITAEARSIVAQFEGREPWAWKDPRNALTLSFWKTLLPSMKVIICVRHPEETASSLVASTLIPRSWPFYWSVRAAQPIHRRLWGAARTSLSSAKRRVLIHEVGLELWRSYNTRILEATRADERLVIHYEAMLTKPRTELDRIVAFARLRISPDALDEIVSVVSPRMRHQRAETLDPQLAELYSSLVRESTDSNISA